MGAEIQLTEIINLKPGNNWKEVSLRNKDLKEKGSRPDFTYKIKVDKNLIQSIQITFKKKIPIESIISKEAQGFCLTQAVAPDVPFKRYFFINNDKNTRFELNSIGDIKEIIIQDMPGAQMHRRCLFREGLQDNEAEIKKVE